MITALGKKFKKDLDSHTGEKQPEELPTDSKGNHIRPNNSKSRKTHKAKPVVEKKDSVQTIEQAQDPEHESDNFENRSESKL